MSYNRHIRNVREARACLREYGLLEDGKPGTNARAKALTYTQRMYLNEMQEGMDAPVGRVREVLGTGIFDSITANVADNELQGGYGSIPADWRKIAKVRSTKDYRGVQSTRFSGLGNIPIVPENGTYKFLAMSDEGVTYTPGKYGALCGISLEAYVSDAIGAFRDMMGEMGIAAANTLNEFVIGTNFDDNPTCDYDAAALFVAAHANRSGDNSGLTLATVAAGITAFANQTGPNSQKIYIRPMGMLVKPSYIVLGAEIAQSAQKIGQGASAVPVASDNAIAAFNLEVSHSPHIDNATTDAAAYLYSNIKAVEIAFVGNTQEPVFFREPDDTGMALTNDSVVWKVRHSYGGDAIEHRGVYVITDDA